MTCIIAHRDGWMVADRRQIWGDASKGPFVVRKIRRWQGGAALVGLSGSTDLVYGRLEPSDYDRDPLDVLPRLMRDAPDDGYSAIVLTKDELGVITGQGCFHAMEAYSSYWATGSGMDLALGYLGGMSLHQPIGPQQAEQAILFVAEYDTGVGDGCQVERL